MSPRSWSFYGAFLQFCCQPAPLFSGHPCSRQRGVLGPRLQGERCWGVAARCWRRRPPGAPPAAPQASAWSDSGSLPQLPLPGSPWRGPGPGGLTSFLQGGSLSAALSLPQEREDGLKRTHHLSLSHGWLSSSSRTPGQPSFEYGSRCCSWRGCNWRCPHHIPPQAPK